MKRKIGFLTMISIIVIAIVTYAASTVTMKLSSDKSSLTAGDEITLTFSVNSIEGIEGGLKTIQGTIDYDENVFEKLTTSSKVDVNGWSTEINTANNMFAGTSSGATSGSVFTLTLKVKEGITAKNTTVTIKDIYTTDTANDDAMINIANTSVTIGSTTINPNNNVIDDSSNNEINNNTNNVISNNTVKNILNVNKKDNTIVASNLPKTGISPYIILSIIVIAVVALISVIRYKNIIK